MKYITCLLFGATLFLILLFTYDTSLLQAFDAKAAAQIGGNKGLALFHYLAETKWMVSIMLLLIVCLWLHGRHYKEIAFVLLAFGGGFALNQGMKHFVARPRPPIVEQLESFSFPSGHAMLGLIYLAVCAYIVKTVFWRSIRPTLVYAPVVVFALGIGLSRVAESRHYMTDVIAGWALAFAWLALCVILYKKYGASRT